MPQMVTIYHNMSLFVHDSLSCTAQARPSRGVGGAPPNLLPFVSVLQSPVVVCFGEYIAACFTESSSIRWNRPILEVLCLMTRFRWEVDGSWRFKATTWYQYSFRVLCFAEAYMQLKDKMRTEFAKDGCLMWNDYFWLIQYMCYYLFLYNGCADDS